jgi:uncharacterized protein
MIDRELIPRIRHSLRSFPVVGLLGARQVGKTTLAREIGGKPAVYLDLERPSDLAKLRDPELYLERYQDRLVILDEIQRKPELFPLLRSLVDAKRRPGRFLLLGSAAPELSRAASESLAGRIQYLELSPFNLRETGSTSLSKLWLRGGFPDSFRAKDCATSFAWREAFIQTYLERDIPALGLKLPSATLRRFWMMLAHHHGQLWNASGLAGSLGLSAPTIRSYLDLLQDTFMARSLQPLHANLGKRLVKRPKVFLRDSGLLHALLGLEDQEALLGHPIAGASWEGFVLEQVLSMIPSTWKASFFRTSAGAELDLVLERPRKHPIGIEIKLSKTPAPTRGFWNALEDLNAKGFVICPANEAYPLAKNASVLPVELLESLLSES